MANGKLDLLDKLNDDGRVLRVQQREINRLEFGKVVLLLGTFHHLLDREGRLRG